MPRKENPSETHPSFGMVSISRVSGRRRLFDSPFEHHHYITLSVHHADRTRTDLHDNQIFPTDEIVEVAMSEVQFANMITSLNIGHGTPCTINHLDGKAIEEPGSDQTKQTFSREAKEHFTHLAAMAEELETLTNIKPAEVKKEQRERMKFLALKMHQAVTCNMDFFHQCFQETMDKVVNVAKSEIDAHVLNVVQKTGLEAIKTMGIGFKDKA